MTQTIAQILSSRVATGLTTLPLIGINTHQRSFMTDAQNVQMLSAMGAKAARIDMVYWHIVEPTLTVPPSYDFSGSANLVALLRSHAMKIDWVLMYNNSHYNTNGIWGGVATQANIDGYIAYCLAALAHYWKPGDLIELWNEPNLNQFWTPTANDAQYANLMTQASAAIRAKYPTATILTAGFSDAGAPDYWTPHLQAVVANGSLVNIDGAAFHFYDQGDLVHQYPEFNVPNYQTVQGVFNGLPLHCTEKGYPLSWASNSETRKAILNLRAVLTSIAMGVASYFHYDMVDDGTGTGSENNYGFYSNALVMLPSGVGFMAISGAWTYMTKYDFSYDQAQSLCWFTIYKPTGVTVIAWTYLRAPAGTPVNFSVPVPGSSIHSCKDLFGAAKPAALANGVLSMTLTEAEGPVIVNI